MSAVSDDVTHCLSDQGWKQLADLEQQHRSIQLDHERMVRSLDEAVTDVECRDLQLAWSQYRQVVAELSRVTEDIESLRLRFA